MTVEAGKVNTSTGTGMALRLGLLLGPRKAWRVWNLARRYGVVLPSGSGDFSPERRNFLQRASLLIAGLFFFPRFTSPTVQAGDQSRPSHRPWNPFEHIKIEATQELDGEAKASALAQALTSQDMRNVVSGDPVGLDTWAAKAAIHTLDTENTLLAVAIPSESTVYAYYELAEPLVEGTIGRYKSQAMLFALESENARLLATSINGRSIDLSSGGSVSELQQDCGGCIDPFNVWEYETVYCSGYNYQCLWGCVGVCAACVVTCAGGITPGCLACLLIVCPWCVFSCCYWDSTCADCGAP